MFGRGLLRRITERKLISKSWTSSLPQQNVWSPYKKWYELSLHEKQLFIRTFVDNYKRHYPGSKTNVSLRGLATGMDAHSDSPSVFGVFYNDIWGTVSRPPKAELATSNKRNRFNHPSFCTLLIKK
ncbi:hypothetical protein HG535_0F00650 [Zygotorulaspora mrakii]|uniref:Uncharacterized protein n=1 Tax=Zygotorulaspora mrakii TaxID=42260 RepID=A0A7H9B4E5_ZYGMR|nr:uncharacterized protein HG535_0F00650 [Zygotorulaspora mrakii]QLG73555.1 hypothetical protein HG535_0F00650 [Zygotorulaspora mrakii]